MKRFSDETKSEHFELYSKHHVWRKDWLKEKSKKVLPTKYLLKESENFYFNEGFQTTVIPSPPLMICYGSSRLRMDEQMEHFHFTAICESWRQCWRRVSVCFTRYRTFVSEDAGPNTLVATVLAKDPDGDGISYKITSGNEEGNFVIDSQKG